MITFIFDILKYYHVIDSIETCYYLLDHDYLDTPLKYISTTTFHIPSMHMLPHNYYQIFPNMYRTDG